MADHAHPGGPASAPRGGCAVDLSLGLLLVCWLLGTPACLYVAAIAGATLFGEPPSSSDLRTATWAAAAAVGCGLGAPALATAIAAFARRKAVAIVAAVVLAVTGTAGVVAVAFSPDTLRAVRDQISPDPEPSRGPVCQERSGGDTRCPGG